MRKRAEVQRFELGLVAAREDELRRFPTVRYTIPELAERQRNQRWTLAQSEAAEEWILWDLYGIDTKTARRLQGNQKARTRAAWIFDLIAVAVPKRLRDEEIGDALEYIQQRIRSGRPVWQIYTKIASTLIWIMINSLRELMSAGLGKAKPR